MEVILEKDILKHIQTGEREKAVALMYKTYFPKVRSLVRSRGGSIEDAKDVFQEAVLKVYLKVIENKIQKEGNNIGGLVMQISQNTWVDKVRKDKRIEFKESLFSSEEAVDVKESSFLSILTKENNQVIEKVLSSIGEKCKELLKLSLLYNLSMKEIAFKLGFSGEESAKTQHYKCKQKLINVYKDNYYLKELLREASND